MTTPEVRLRRLAHGDGLPLPAYQSAHAAGLDLAAAVPRNSSQTGKAVTPLLHRGLAMV